MQFSLIIVIILLKYSSEKRGDTFEDSYNIDPRFAVPDFGGSGVGFHLSDLTRHHKLGQYIGNRGERVVFYS